MIASIVGSLLQRDDQRRDHTGWSPFGGIFGAAGSYANYDTTSGEVVNEKTAMLLGAHFGCVRCKSEDLGMFPIDVYELDDRGERESKPDDPVFHILNFEFNSEMNAMVGKTTLLAHAIAFKKGIAEIAWTNGNEPMGLYPLDPTRVTKVRKNGEILHVYVDDGGREHGIPDEDVVEIIGPSYDGLLAYSLAELSKFAIGTALAAQRFQGSFFGNGAWMGGVIEKLPKGTKPEAIDSLRESFNRRHQGAGRAFGVGIIPGGGEFKEIGTDPQRGQVQELLKYSVAEICRFHRVPPHKVQDYENAHYNNVEQGEIVYRGDALMPLGTTLELEIYRKLLRKRRRARINYNALQRVDFKTQMEGLAIGRMWGIYTINEARKKIGEDPIPGQHGDMRLIPANMIPIENAYAPRDQQSTNAKSPSSKPDPSASEDLKAAFLPTVIEGLQRAAAKEEKAMERLRKKGSGHEAEVNAFYDEHKMYVGSCVIPTLGCMVRVAGDAVANAERLQIIGHMYCTEWVKVRPAAAGPVDKRWLESFAARWVNATLAATIEVETAA